MIIKKITIDGKEVLFGASARTARLYRERYGRDAFYDFASLFSKVKKIMEERHAASVSELDLPTQLAVLDLQMFENLAYTMAKQATPSIPDNEGEWLDEFGVFDIFEIFPQLMELWDKNKQGMSVPKKK